MVTAVGWFLAAVVLAQPAGGEGAPAPADVARAIRQLSAREFETRQQATQFLWQAGTAVEPALQEALRETSDRETRLRIESILDDFRYGVFASTPPEVAQLVRRYRRSEPEERSALWRDLLRQAPLETLLAVADVESSSAQRLQILERLENEGAIGTALPLAEKWREQGVPGRSNKFDEFISRHIPYLLAQRDYHRAEQILTRAADTEEGIRNWAVYLHLTGKLDPKVRELQTLAAGPGPLDAARVRSLQQLVHLLRVQGDFTVARDAAQQLVDRLRSGGEARFSEELAAAEQLLRSLLFDLQDWPALARWQEKRAQTFVDNIEELGFAAAFHRLAGEQEAFERVLERVRGLAERESGESLSYCREIFFLNGRTAEAIRLLDRSEPAEAFSVRLLQQRFTEAFETAELGLTRESRELWLQTVVEAAGAQSRQGDRLFRLAVHAAQALHSLGERDEAEAMFSRLAEAAKTNRDTAKLRQLAEFELKAGLTDSAFEHIALAIAREPNESGQSLNVLFSRHLEGANSWWEMFEALPPRQSYQERLTRLRKLFYRGAVDEELRTQLSSMLETIEKSDVEVGRRARWLNSVGETALLREQKDFARRCFELIAGESATATMHLADLAASQQDWNTAAQWYQQTWTQSRRPDALYLHGLMLVKAGNEPEGRQAIQLATLVPLASAARHEHLAAGLARRGFTAEATSQWDLLRRCSSWSEGQMFAAIAGLGDALSGEDPLRAAALWEQRMLNCLQNNWYFTDVGSYVRIPFLVHQTRAKGLLDQGRVEEALRELKFCRQIWPGHAGLAEEFVPRLAGGSGSTAAEEMFDEAFHLLEETCRTFPRSAMHHNNLAWMSARCGKRLDEALTHAERALELVPNSAQYLDTLGEVHFRRGAVDQAIACARRCIELDPQTDFYRQQLERFLHAKQQPP